MQRACKGRRTARTFDPYRNISLAHRDPTAESVPWPRTASIGGQHAFMPTSGLAFSPKTTFGLVSSSAENL